MKDSISRQKVKTVNFFADCSSQRDIKRARQPKAIIRKNIRWGHESITAHKTGDIRIGQHRNETKRREEMKNPKASTSRDRRREQKLTGSSEE